jgi:hypothetical protein
LEYIADIADAGREPSLEPWIDIAHILFAVLRVGSGKPKQAQSKVRSSKRRK